MRALSIGWTVTVDQENGDYECYLLPAVSLSNHTPGGQGKGTFIVLQFGCLSVWTGLEVL